MARRTPNQQSFSSGELSPLMQGRTDIEDYEQGLSTCLNMYPDPRGPAVNRESMEHVLTVADDYARIETYNRSDSEMFTFIFTDLKLQYIRNIEFPETIEFVSPWTKEQVDEVYIIPKPDGRTFYLLHPEVPTYKLIDLTSKAQTETFGTPGAFLWTVPLTVTEVTVCITGGGGGGGGAQIGEWEQFIFTAAGAGGGGSGSVKIIRPVTPGDDISLVVGSGGAGGSAASSELIDAGNGVEGTFSDFDGFGSTPGIGGGGAANGYPSTLFGQGFEGGGDGGLGGRGRHATIDQYTQDGQGTTSVCKGRSYLGGIGGGFEPSSRYTAWDIGGGGGGAGGGGDGGDGWNYRADNTSAVNGKGPGAGGGGGAAANTGHGPAFGQQQGFSTPGADGADGEVKITYVDNVATVTLEEVAFTNAPPEWLDNNWPSCGAYFKNRLYLAAAPAQQETLWASVLGSPEDFDLDTSGGGAGSDAADAISFIMEDFGTIEWLVGTKSLLMGTAVGEYILASDGPNIAANDFQVIQQSAYGSASIQPVKIGDQIIYVTPDRRKVRAMNFEERKNNWMSTDLTLLSEHVTRPLIKELSWAQHPNNLLWVTLMDGTLACLSYERGDNVKGWSRHVTQGAVLSTSAGFDGSRSTLTLITSRKSGQVEFERLADAHYMDGWKQVSALGSFFNGNSNLIYTAGGFDHLEGLTVEVILRGKYFYTRVVGAESEPGLADGQAGFIYMPLADFGDAVPNTIGPLLAGVSYEAKLRLLDLDGGANTGSASGLKKRRNKIYVRISESGDPNINGEQPVVEEGKELPAVESKIIEVADLDWDRGASVVVSQSFPLPLKVLAIYGEVVKNLL